MTAQERLTHALADRYRVERELGQGGTVYFAHDLRTQRTSPLCADPRMNALLDGCRGEGLHEAGAMAPRAAPPCSDPDNR